MATRQVTDTRGYLISGRKTARQVGHIAFPEVTLPSLTSTPQIHTSVDALRPDYSKVNKPTCELLDDAVILNGKRHCLPLTKEYVLSGFRDIFEGKGKLPGGKYHIQFKPDAQPAQHPPRAVPEKKKAAYKEELEKLCSSGIIDQVRGHTDWSNSVVPVSMPDGSIRSCLDPKDLNNSTKRNQYYMKTIDKVNAELHGGEYFTLVDAKTGYWMVELDNESSLLTTFNTPWGKYRWLRLPCGLKVSADVFQEKLNAVLKEVTGITRCIDDILTRGVDSKDHDVNLLQLLETARMNGIKLNPKKLQFKTTKCDLFGQTIAPESMKIDDKKVEASNKWKRQETRKLYRVPRELFEALLSQVDETIRTTQTAASGRNGMDLGLFPSRCLRCHQERALQGPSTCILSPESRTRYHQRMLSQHRKGVDRSDVRHGEASQLCLWCTSRSENRS